MTRFKNCASFVLIIAFILFNITYPSKAVFAASEKPEAIGEYPNSSDGSTLFDENTINSKTIDGTVRYFLKITFNDPNSNLTFDGATSLAILRDSCYVYAEGSSTSMIDVSFLTEILSMGSAERQTYIDQYIFTRDTTNKVAYLYIPVKLLRSNTTYDVKIMPEVVYFSDMTVSEWGNDTITWSFTTMSNPYIDSVSPGSVGEDYDEDEPIIIKGGSFYSASIDVYFNDIESERVRVKTDSNGNSYIQAYLPSGSDSLEPGVYNITVANDVYHQKTIYGALSIVKAGDGLPTEGTVVKKSTGKGDVVSNALISEDTLELKSKYNDSSYLELDLDDLMGEDVLVRKIKVDGNTSHSIGILETVSKWCNISLYDLTSDYSSDSDEIVMSLGRTEPEVSKALKDKLRGYGIKSELIQVTGENFLLDKVVLDIPYRNSDGDNLKVMRYDEETRSWVPISCTVNRVDMTVNVESYKSGIFVVVE